MIRPWRIELKRRGEWHVFACYATEENAKRALPWARLQYWNVQDARVRPRSGWQR